MKIVRNIKFSDEARNWVLCHYMWSDTDDLSELLYIPTLYYTLETRDGAGDKIAGPGFSFGKQRSDRLADHVIAPFDNGHKFIAIRFCPAEHDEKASYMIEYFDGIWYVLKE